MSQADVGPKDAIEETCITVSGRAGGFVSEVTVSYIGTEESISRRPSQPQDVWVKGVANRTFWRDGVEPTNAARMASKSYSLSCVVKSFILLPYAPR